MFLSGFYYEQAACNIYTTAQKYFITCYRYVRLIKEKMVLFPSYLCGLPGSARTKRFASRPVNRKNVNKISKGLISKRQKREGKEPGCRKVGKLRIGCPAAQMGKKLLTIAPI